MSRRHAQNLETVWIDALPEEAVPAVEAALQRACRTVSLFLDEATDTWRVEGVREEGAKEDDLTAALALASLMTGLDLVPERLEMARRHGIETLDVSRLDNVPDALIDLVDGRGPDAVIDAVGMEAHGSTSGKLAQAAAGMLPDKLARTMTDRAGVDRLTVLHAALKAVRRGGTSAPYDLVAAAGPLLRCRITTALRWGSAPVLTMTRSAYAADGVPVEYGSHSYRADQYTIDVLVHEH